MSAYASGAGQPGRRRGRRAARILAGRAQAVGQPEREAKPGGHCEHRQQIDGRAAHAVDRAGVAREVSRSGSKVDSLTTVIAIAFLAVFFVIEGRLRVGDEARSLASGAADRGTTRGIGLAFGFSIVCVLVSPLVNTIGVGRLPEPAAWSGLVIMVGAIGLRVWAARVLGASYTRTLRTSAGQRLVQAGPYGLIRHPGYAADIALWLGGGLATSNIVIVLVVLLVVSAAYRARIAAEEAMLLEAFGDDYRTYSRRTWRLIPRLY